MMMVLIMLMKILLQLNWYYLLLFHQYNQMSKCRRRWRITVLAFMLGFIVYTMKTRNNFKEKSLVYFEVPKYPLRELKFPPFPSEKFSQCENILTNLTRGRWVKKYSFLEKRSEQYQELLKRERYVEMEMHEYRLARGIYKSPFREDKKCGYSNFAEVPKGSDWVPSGSWCDVKSNQSCCSNEYEGNCVSYDLTSGCTCEGCVDMRRYIHADVSDWHTSDARCQPRNYSASELCDVMSKFKEIHFVGDSIMRKIYRAFLLTLTSDINHGAFSTDFTPEVMDLCVENKQFYWKECRFIASSLDKLLHKELLCGGKRNPPFTWTSQTLYNLEYSGEFFHLIKGLSGRPGSLVLVGVGLHMQLKAEDVIEKYLGPAVEYSEQYFYNQLAFNHSTPLKKWPLIVFVPPDIPGLLKQVKYMKFQGKKAVNNYKEKMKKYCEKHNIPVLDFGDLTTNVRSYDGAHYGRSINLMKIQFLLNYLDSIRV